MPSIQIMETFSQYLNAIIIPDKVQYSSLDLYNGLVHNPTGLELSNIGCRGVVQLRGSR